MTLIAAAQESSRGETSEPEHKVPSLASAAAAGSVSQAG